MNPPVPACGNLLYQTSVHPADFKDRVGNPYRLIGGVYLDKFQPAVRRIIEGQGLRFALFDEDALGSGIHHIAVSGADFFRRDGRAGFQATDGNAPVAVRGVLALVGSYGGSGTVGNQEPDALNGLRGPLDKLLDCQNFFRGIVESQRLRVVGADFDCLRRIIQDIPGGGLGFLHHQRTSGQTGDKDLSLIIRSVKAVACQFPSRVGNVLPLRRQHLELRAFQRRICGLVPLDNHQGSGQAVVEVERLRRAGLDGNGLGRRIQGVTVSGPRLLGGNHRAGDEIVNDNPSVSNGAGPEIPGIR